MQSETDIWSPEVLTFCKNLSPGLSKKLPFQKPFFDGIDNSKLVFQVEGYRKLKDKIPTWWERGDLVLPDSVAVEQCTSEWVARWKTTLLEFEKLVFVDACAGFGVDAWFLGKDYKRKYLFETDPNRLAFLDRNLKTLGYSDFEVFQKPFLQSLSEGELEIPSNSMIYIDPDRRSGAVGRAWNWQDSNPNLEEIYHTVKKIGAQLFVKLSPMDNPTEIVSQLPGAKAIYTISLQNEVKEVLVLWDFSISGHYPVLKRFVVEIQKAGFYRQIEIPVSSSVSTQLSDPMVGGYLLDPWAALRKGNQAQNWMNERGFKSIGSGTELYFSDQKPEDFPGRVFRIHSLPHELNDFGKRTRKQAMQVVCRNFPEKPDALKKKYLWSEGQLDFLFCYGDARGKKRYIYAQKEEANMNPDNWKQLPALY